MRFEPSGTTNDPDIRAAKSIVDYIFRWMGKKFLTTDQQEEIGILSPEVRARLAASYNATRRVTEQHSKTRGIMPRASRPSADSISRTGVRLIKEDFASAVRNRNAARICYLLLGDDDPPRVVRGAG